ncbi:MAG: hypothetical protein KTR29_06550, partial [Rhodothermaceae bacterium]|nr:hypothetical protein [Rhodothermaceae bacterium]
MKELTARIDPSITPLQGDGKKGQSKNLNHSIVIRSLSFCLIIWHVTAIVLCAQDANVHEKYGVEIDFPEGWYLAGEIPYSSMMQSQLFLDRDTLHWIALERYLALSQINRNNWHLGLPYGHPFDQAERITEIEEAHWPVKIPEMEKVLFQTSKTGARVFLLELQDSAVYVLFLARGSAYVRLMVGTRAPGFDLDSKVVEDLLRRIKISPS